MKSRVPDLGTWETSLLGRPLDFSETRGLGWGGEGDGDGGGDRDGDNNRAPMGIQKDT